MGAKLIKRFSCIYWDDHNGFNSSISWNSVSPWFEDIKNFLIKLHLIMVSVQFSLSVVSNSLRSQKLKHTRLPCPSPTPGVYPNSSPLSQWWHPAISSSVILFSSCLQSFPASGSFPMRQFFASGVQSIGASASVLPMNIQDWSPLGWTSWISLQSKGLSRVFSNTTVQKYQFFGAHLSSQSNSPGDYWRFSVYLWIPISLWKALSQGFLSLFIPCWPHWKIWFFVEVFLVATICLSHPSTS